MHSFRSADYHSKVWGLWDFFNVKKINSKDTIVSYKVRIVRSPHCDVKASKCKKK